MNVRYRVALETSERVQLVELVLGGDAPVRRLERAQILSISHTVRSAGRRRFRTVAVAVAVAVAVPYPRSPARGA